MNATIGGKPQWKQPTPVFARVHHRYEATEAGNPDGIRIILEQARYKSGTIGEVLLTMDFEEARDFVSRLLDAIGETAGTI